MKPEVLLSLIHDLQEQVLKLRAANSELACQLAEAKKPSEPPSWW